MRAHPELIGGEGATDTTLMRTLDGWIAKGGAEGLMCRRLARRPRDRAQGRGRRLPRAPAGARRFRAQLGLDAPTLRRRCCPKQPRRGCGRRPRVCRKNASESASSCVTSDPSRGAPGAGRDRLSCFCCRGSSKPPPAGGPRCSPSTSLFPTSRSSTSSFRTGTRRASSRTTRSSAGLEEVELTKEQIEDFYTYLIDHSIELVEGEQHKHPPHEQPRSPRRRRARSST